MKKIVSTLLAIILLAMGSTLASAQNTKPAIPTTVPDVATKSDVQGLRRELRQSAAQQAAQLKAIKEAQKQAEVQRKAEAEKLQAADALRREAEEKREAENAHRMYLLEVRGGVIGGIIFVFISLLFATRNYKASNLEKAMSADRSPRRSPTPEELYGKCPTPQEVRDCLNDHKLNFALFTVHLPVDQLIFEYRAKRMPDGNVMAYFKDNDKPIALELQKLRKIAKGLYAENVLEPVSKTPTDRFRYIS